MTHNSILPTVVSALLIFILTSCASRLAAPAHRLVELLPIELDSSNPERTQFGRLTFISAFQLRSRDDRFGGLSGLSIGADGKLYAISDRGYWNSARMVFDADGRLVSLSDWEIQPVLSTTGAPVGNPLWDAEALAQAPDGSFIVAFEHLHRIWRYAAPPATFASLPVPVPTPVELARAPVNGGIEATTVLPDGRILAIAEEFANPDGSFKGWLMDNGRFAELSYVPSDGFRASDCVALKNGDLLVLERRYVPLATLLGRIKLVRARDIRPGARLSGEELIRLESPLEVDNFEGIAAQQDPAHGTMIFLVSDDNYHMFQRTLLLQFRLNEGEH